VAGLAGVYDPDQTGHLVPSSIATRRFQNVTTANLPASIDVQEAIEAFYDSLPALNIDEVTERTLLRTLTATTVAEILADPKSISLENMLYEPFTLLGVEGWLPSTVRDHEDDRYVICRAARADGEVFTFSTGSQFCVTRIAQLMKLNALPVVLKGIGLVSKSDSTRTSYWLVGAHFPTSLASANGATGNA
jgi:hypothetical protein